MIKVSRNEVLHIAKLSGLEISEQEISRLIEDIEETLNYAARVQEIASGQEEISSKNINVFRDDAIRVVDYQPILANVPKREEHFVVVPVVLD